MLIARTIEETRRHLAGRGSIGFVPTMGALHEGHLTLMRRAAEENDIAVASIFVNPTQFGPSEDFAAYPRDLTRDAAFAESTGVQLIFNPSVDEIYPEGYNTYIEVEGLTEGLCGAHRPGHFRGVATVVLKLLNIVQPTRAYFGEKDYQQLAVIRRMVKDLAVPVEIVGVPIVREADGLAMSSRNAYLSPEEREAATVLHKALRYADELDLPPREIEKQVAEFIAQEPLAQVEYVSLVHPETLAPAEESRGAVLALAVRIGKARLIDNARLRCR
ncbi:MAG: pantoate--beta-alanine ligase [Armatimonadota bacterium]